MVAFFLKEIDYFSHHGLGQIIAYDGLGHSYSMTVWVRVIVYEGLGQTHTHK